MRKNRLTVTCLSTLCAAALLQAEELSPNHFKRPEQIEADHPMFARGGAQPQLASGPSGYTPAQVRKAYGLDQITGDGTGQTIAIVDAYGNPALQNDLNAFCTKFNLPKTTLQVYYPQGLPLANSGWALETNLDVEWAHAIAPGAKIIVVIAKSSNLSNLLAAVDYAVQLGAKQVSMSWGGAEFAAETGYDNQHFNKPGVTFTAASGDNGATGTNVLWPAASPYVIGVGGTTLKLDTTGAVTSETAWSGSGGGTSAYETQPTWQNIWQNTGKRGVPDVSYNADPATGFPVYISNYNRSTGWATVGGTSAGAPQWAAIFALANSARTTSVSGADAVLYKLGIQNNYANYDALFRDVSKGSNGKYLAELFYDFVTGLGSPLGAKLVPALRTN